MTWLFTTTTPNLYCGLCHKYHPGVAPLAASNKHEELLEFADDSTLGASATEEKFLILKLQTMAEKVYNWFDSTRLAMNVKKPHLLIFSRIGKSCLREMELYFKRSYTPLT